MSEKMIDKIRIGIFVAICATLILCVIIGLFNGGVAFLKPSAIRNGNGFVWGGVEYVYCNGEYEVTTQALAKTDDGYLLLGIEGDGEHNFIVLSSFLDSRLCVRADYIPLENDVIGSVFWGGKKINDEDFCRAVGCVTENFKIDFTFQTDRIISVNMKEVYLSYGDCPVGTKFAGYMGRIDDDFVFCVRTYGDKVVYPEPFTYDAYKIPKEYLEIIGEYCG